MNGPVNIGGGWWALQDFDATDRFGGSYGITNLPINYGARYGKILSSDGIPQFRQIEGTQGPVAGWFCWPGNTPDRVFGQWAQVFPAKITSANKATPVVAGDGSGWVTTPLSAPEALKEITVFTSDGSAPEVGSFGIVVTGVSLHNQTALFFQGGSGGSSMQFFKVVTNHGDGTYLGQPIEYPNGPNDGSQVDGLTENNGSTAVPANQVIEVNFRTVSGNDVGFFSMPFGCP